MCSFATGGVIGYAIAHRTATQELTQLQHEYHRGLVREQELRTQLQDALAQQAALAQESQRLQEHVSERLRRLEEAAAKLTPPKQSE
jgi:predicted  nucleic acid-binding Zn-ribbon protein